MREVEASWRGAVFVCTHHRDPETGRACCGTEAGTELRDWIKARMKRAGLKGEILTAKSGCLDVCSPLGITVCAAPVAGSGLPRRMWVVEPTDDREAVFAELVAALRPTAGSNA